MKLSFINEGIFEPHKSPIERGENSLIYSTLLFFWAKIDNLHLL